MAQSLLELPKLFFRQFFFPLAAVFYQQGVMTNRIPLAKKNNYLRS